jgi:photosystem II stability/assembly factor-like uncharacterized protein
MNEDARRGPIPIERVPWTEWHEGVRFGSEVCAYADSNKVLVRALDGAIFRDGAQTDYWEGEHVDEPIAPEP